ncbi:MAG: ABC transporter permease, partial [bacterium]
DVAYAENMLVWAGLIGLTLFVGIAAGSYPAFFLAGFRPIQVLQGSITIGTLKRRPIRLRSVLVVAQFVISIALIIITAGIHKQLLFIQNNRLGFEKEHIIVIPIRDDALQNKYTTFKNGILSNSGIMSATALSNFPWAQGYYGFPMLAEGMAQDADANIATLIVDPDFIDAFGIQIVEGRGFSKELVSDAGSAFIINEAAVKKLGWETAVGKSFEVKKIVSGQDLKGRVVGVMQDFHLRSLHHEIEPLVVLVSPVTYYLDNLAIRISGSDVQAELAALEQTWRSFAPHRPFEYFFLDEAFHQLYQQEQKLGNIFDYFAGLTIFVGCLGLFGLASFMAEQRTKEIGIRKVMGASVSGIVVLLSKDFARLILVAFVIAVPLALYFINRWLQDFAYKTMPDAWTFLLAAGLVLSIALLTVSYQSIKAALTNPVEALRYE